MRTRIRGRHKPESRRCPFCHESVGVGGDEIKVCSECHTWHHQDCWEQNNNNCSVAFCTKSVRRHPSTDEEDQSQSVRVVRADHYDQPLLKLLLRTTVSWFRARSDKKRQKREAEERQADRDWEKLRANLIARGNTTWPNRQDYSKVGKGILVAILLYSTAALVPIIVGLLTRFGYLTDIRYQVASLVFWVLVFCVTLKIRPWRKDLPKWMTTTSKDPPRMAGENEHEHFWRVYAMGLDTLGAPMREPGEEFEVWLERFQRWEEDYDNGR